MMPQRAKLVARSDVPVLLLGETGSGKEVFARHVHEESRRAGRLFLKVNCSVVPSELIDSYLFGHEKGLLPGPLTAAKVGSKRPNVIAYRKMKFCLVAKTVMPLGNRENKHIKYVDHFQRE